MQCTWEIKRVVTVSGKEPVYIYTHLWKTRRSCSLTNEKEAIQYYEEGNSNEIKPLEMFKLQKRRYFILRCVYAYVYSVDISLRLLRMHDFPTFPFHVWELLFLHQRKVYIFLRDSVSLSVVEVPCLWRNGIYSDWSSKGVPSKRKLV